MKKHEEIMSQLKKDWDDIAARTQVSEVGLDVDRAELIRRYHEEEKLTPNEIADGVRLTVSHITKLIRCGRYVSRCSAEQREPRITEFRFRAYWKQISDPRQTRRKKSPDFDPEDYEAKCFGDIRKMVEAGKAPLKPKKREKQIEPKDVKGIREITKAAKHVFRKDGPLRNKLDSLKRLAGADRSTYAPTLLAGAAEVIEREIKALIKILIEAGEDTTEHGQPATTNAGN